MRDFVVLDEQNVDRQLDSDAVADKFHQIS